MELSPGVNGAFQVFGGIGATIDAHDRSVAILGVFDEPISNEPHAHRPPFRVTKDPQTFTVRAGTWGSSLIVATWQGLGPSWSTQAALRVKVKDPRGTVYHPTEAHNQPACTDPNCWNDICSNPDNDFGNPSVQLTLYAYTHPTPRETVEKAKSWEFDKKPIALKHFQQYIDGTGATYNEDANLADWLTNDKSAQGWIRWEMNRRAGTNLVKFITEFDQMLFAKTDAAQDYCYSFGSIDKLEVEVDYVHGTVRVWFLDCYEWHPVYPKYFSKCAKDVKRISNFLHAAAVQLKLDGAKDFWMKGEATFPISMFLK
jgi:hypothetical protein